MPGNQLYEQQEAKLSLG